MSALVLENKRMSMRGKPAEPRKTPFAQWLFDNRKKRGLTMVQLAERAGVSHARIVQLEKGDTPSRDMVERLSRGMAGVDPDHYALLTLLNDGLRATGFAPKEEERYDAEEDVAFLRGLPPRERAQAGQILRALIVKDDNDDNAGNIGKRAE